MSSAPVIEDFDIFKQTSLRFILRGDPIGSVPGCAPSFFCELCNQFNLVVIVIITEKDLLSSITALVYMVRISGNNETSHPGHIQPPC